MLSDESFAACSLDELLSVCELCECCNPEVSSGSGLGSGQWRPFKFLVWTGLQVSVFRGSPIP